MPTPRGPSPAEPRRPLPSHLRGRLDPEDLAQETWVRALRARGDLSQFGTAEREKYLRETFGSALSDQVRRFDRSKRRASRERPLSSDPDGQPTFPEEWLIADHTSPTGRARRAEDAARLAAALAQLPDDQRLAIDLHHLRGQSLKETAAAMGRSPHSVAGLIRRGLAALRVLLAESP